MFGTSQQQTGGGLFGQSQQSTGGGLFGQTQQQQPQQQQQPATGGLFGSLGGQSTQQSGGLFGGIGQSTQQNQQPQQQSGGLFGGLGQSTQQNQQPQQPSGGLFGGLGQNQQNQQTQQQSGGLFGGLGQSTQQQQQQPQQQNGLFNSSQQQPSGQSAQQNVSRLGQSTALWEPNSSVSSREKSVPDQIKTVVDKWDINSPNCAFQYYFYNKVPEHMAPFYSAPANEDPKAWEEALSKKPGPGYIPALCTGFLQLGKRITNQQQNLASFNTRLHEINNALSAMLQTHETRTSIRAMDAKRKHVVLRQRCLALATKVQVLRNRGYALGGDEEDLRSKLQDLEKGASDPGLGARAEEIWARMVTVQERAKLLKSEIEKSGVESSDMLDESTTRQAKKILEDYDRQLLHLKKELDTIQKEYVKWEKEQQPIPPKVSGR